LTINSNGICECDDHAYSWCKLLDSSYKNISLDSKLDCVKIIFEKFKSLSPSVPEQEIVRILAHAKNREGNKAINITNAVIRDYLNSILFFLGRYDIFPGPPVYQSATAIVVYAYDHGVYNAVFDNHLNQLKSELDDASKNVLNQEEFIDLVFTFMNLEGDISDHEDDLKKDFESIDKDKSDGVSSKEFYDYCCRKHGPTMKVVLKFMKNKDEYDREILNRNTNKLDNRHVVGLLPAHDEKLFYDEAAKLTLNNESLSTQNHRYGLVMYAADRSLDDIFNKERPDDSHIRTMLCEIVEALLFIHSKELGNSVF
jgi:hypothetical protein